MENWRKYIKLEEEKSNFFKKMRAKQKRCKGKPKTGECAPDPPTPEQWKKITAKNESLDEEYYHITDATYDDGSIAEDVEFWDDVIEEAEYRGRKVKLNKPMRGDVKKSKVYVKNAKGNVVKVNFGDKKMKIKKSNPKRRKSFRARHNCKNPGPKWKARYWSCKAW